MRVSTAFNKMLGIVGATVASVTFTPSGVVVGLRRRRSKPVCPCGRKSKATYDRSVRRWRHLDLAGSKLWLEAEIRRVNCRACGRVRTEDVPWARPGARHTRDVQDLVGSWRSGWTRRRSPGCCGSAGKPLLASSSTSSPTSWTPPASTACSASVSTRSPTAKGHRYLTVVADHDRDGAVVWAAEGKSAKTLQAFYDELGAERCGLLEAVSLDMGGAYKKATDGRAGQARQCVDPFHLVKLANEAVDKTRRWSWNVHRDFGIASSRWVKRTRWALLKEPADLTDSQLDVLHELRRNRSVLDRCWQLKEAVRDLYRLARPADAAKHLDWWLAWACRSRIPAFVTLSKTIRPTATASSPPLSSACRTRTWKG